jgi:hypothetical protein
MAQNKHSRSPAKVLISRHLDNFKEELTIKEFDGHLIKHTNKQNRRQPTPANAI